MDPIEQVNAIEQYQQQQQQHWDARNNSESIFDAAAKSAVQGVGVALFLKWLFGRRG